MSAVPEIRPLLQIELNGGAAVVSYDSHKWDHCEKKANGKFSLDRVGGIGTAVIIAERTGIPTGLLTDALLEELKKEHPELNLLSRETRLVNGREVGCLKCSCKANGIDLVLYTYCFGGLAGSFQVRTCARAAAFEECEPDFAELLNSLVIRPAAHPALARMRHNLRVALRVTRAGALVILFGSLGICLRSSWRTGLLVGAALTLAVLAIAWVYALRQYRLD